MDELAKRPDFGIDRAFSRLWEEVDHLFAQAMGIFTETGWSSGTAFGMGDLLPKVEIERRGSEILATVTVAGARPDSLEVSVSAESLTVRGEAETKAEQVQSFRSFYRTVPLPAKVRPEAARTEQKGENCLVVRVPVA
ncbi:MAG: Hsp20/alpha crystallin family protein [Methanocella sp.]